MIFARLVYLASAAVFILSCGMPREASAGAIRSFLFGADAGGIQGVVVGQPSATLTLGGVAALFEAGPAGAVLSDRNAQGLGVNSSNVPGANDATTSSDPTKMNLIKGATPLAGQGESLIFSFDREGTLQTLLFDGLKDETLEYVRLELPDGQVRTLFDSQTQFRLSVQGFDLTDLLVSNPIQAQTENDDLADINYRFAAGDRFRLTYGEGNYGDVPGYRAFLNIPIGLPQPTGDGVRFQGVVIEIPEPSSIAMLGLVALPVSRRTKAARGSAIPSCRYSWGTISSPA